MDALFRIRLQRLISAFLIICLCVTLLPPSSPSVALAPSLPDYSARLLSISGTLERDGKGGLRFPYPETRPNTARQGASPDKVVPLSGQNSRTAGGTASPPLPLIAFQPTGFSPKPPFQDSVEPKQSAPSFRSFLPTVYSNHMTAAPLGKKALLQILLPNPERLAADLSFSEAQLQVVQQVIDAERAALAALDEEAAVITGDIETSLQEKHAAIAAMDYNGRLHIILQASQRALQEQLGDPAYGQLVAWLNRAWQTLLVQRNAVRSATGDTVQAAQAELETCPTFTVFATRSIYTDLSADLPDRYIKAANRDIEYSEGYTNNTYSITVQLNSEILENLVITDVAPHNQDDNYWNTNDDPIHPRRLFRDLPHGMPEAEAAYFDNYNNGLNQFGQEVTNPAGVNLSETAARQLGMIGNEWVEVTYPWDCVPDEQVRQNRIERSWGTNDWNQTVAQLVNPVTGNQSLWARDLYLAAPGLPVDIVRYYNSRDGSDGIFGRGWSSEFDMRVYPQSDGSYKVRYEDGERATFHPDGSGGYRGEPGVFDSFATTGSGYVLTLADEQITYRFGDNGRLQTIEDLSGNQITLSYSGGNPTTITDSAGRSYSLTFDSNGHVTRIEDPIGRVVTYEYAEPTVAAAVLGISVASVAQVESAALTSVTDPNQGTTTYEYDPATAAMSRAIDADGIAFIENQYDEQGRVRQQRNADGETGEIEHDPQNRRSVFTDNLGNKTTYIYDRQQRLIEEIDALGNSITYTYNDRDQMIARTDKRGFTWRYEYDERGNVIRREDPVDEHSAKYYSTDVTLMEYNELNLVTKLTDALGNVTTYEYDADGNLTKVTEPNGATTISVFNNKGQMISLTDAEGNVTRYGYDAQGNRNEIIDANGGVTRMTYDDAGRVLTQTDPEGNTTTYEYDGNGNVTAITDPLGNVSRLEYNGNNQITKEIDRRGATTTYRYDKDLNLIEVEDALGYVTRYEYDAMHNRTKLIDANGNVTTYAYDDLYRITSMTDPLGATTSYVYDANNNVLSTTDALGNTTRYEYDAMGRRISVTDPLGNKTELIYDQLDRVIQTIDALGAVSRYEYDNVGNLVRIINPLNGVTTHEYDLLHNRTSTTDPNGHTSTITYDSLGREIAHTDALGRVLRSEYDKIGNTTVITDPKGGVTTFEYNANSWLIRSTDPLGAQVSRTYDEEGNEISFTDANGHSATTVYDLRGAAISITDALGKTTRFTYDANGNRISETDPTGDVTRYEFGTGDLLVRMVDPLAHPVVLEYDLLGRVIRTTDANGKATTFQYDALDRVVAVTDAKGQNTKYSYDARGNLASITDANGNTTDFEYNALNQVVKETNSIGKTWHYSYDGVGNLIEKIDGRNQAIRYEYDEVDQLIRKSFPDGKSVIYEYDANGNRVQMTDWNGVFTATFDAANQATSSTDHKGRRLAFTYDAIGNRISLIYPDDRAVHYHYDARDQLIAMDDPDGRRMLYKYDDDGRLINQVRPNNTRTDFTYDAAGRLTSVHTTGPAGAIIGNFDYTLDSVGNRMQVVATRPGDAPVTYSYTYDDIYQLVGASSDNGQALSYAYDAVGNRQSVEGMTEPVPPTLPSVPISSTYEYNAIYSMLRAGNALMSYDDNGNRIRSEKPLADTKYAELGLNGTLVTEYTFDVEDHLVEARETIRYFPERSSDLKSVVVMEADYSYDGQRRRIAKLVQTYNFQGGRLDVLLREYVYDGFNVVSEYEYHNGATTPDVTYYYYANDEKVTLERTNANGEKQLYWYAYDAQGSTTALLDGAGAVAAEYQSDEFGKLLTGNSQLNHYLFTGQEYDPETGLYHFFARYYDPETGVWISQDRQRGIAAGQATWHRYAYVLNNPVNSVDALGYWPDWLDDAANKVADIANDYVVEPVKDIAAGAKEVAKDAADAVNRHVVKPVVRTAKKVKDAAERTYKAAERRVIETARDINDNYIKPAREKAAEALKTAREGITKAADWVQEHKDEVAMVAGAVGAIAAGAVFCGATAGIGCAVIAGVAGGALVAGGVQAGANVLDSSADTDFFDNVGRAALVGGATGGLDALTGGLAGRALSAARPMVQRSATALAQRVGSVARRVAPRTSSALTRGAGSVARGLGGAARSLNAASHRASVGLRSVMRRGCRNSFSPDTLVITESGKQPISTIKVGERVLAYHEVLATTEMYTVTAVISHTDSVVEILTIDGEQLETTSEHPFYTQERAWVVAGQLWSGAHVYRADGKIGTVQKVETVQRHQPMYNLTITKAGTFFVGSGEWLVHNCPELPVFTGGKTRGVLDTGSEQIPLVSGYKGPSQHMPADTPGMTTAMTTRADVESHAAAIMRQKNLKEATLYINNSPCKGPLGCDTMLEHKLPEGATLHVKVMQGAGEWKQTKSYTGKPDSAWNWAEVRASLSQR